MIKRIKGGGARCVCGGGGCKKRRRGNVDKKGRGREKEEGKRGYVCMGGEERRRVGNRTVMEGKEGAEVNGLIGVERKG